MEMDVIQIILSKSIFIGMEAADIITKTHNNTMTHLLALVLGFVLGALVFRNNAKKATDLEQKSKSILDALKGK